MKFMSRTRFNHLLLSITFEISYEDLDLIFYIWVFYTTIEVIMEKIQFKQYFPTTFRPLTQKIMVLVYWSTILVHFTMLAPLD